MFIAAPAAVRKQAQASKIERLFYIAIVSYFQFIINPFHIKNNFRALLQSIR